MDISLVAQLHPNDRIQLNPFSPYLATIETFGTVLDVSIAFRTVTIQWDCQSEPELRSFDAFELITKIE